MKDWISLFGIVKGKYSSVNNGATSTAQQASWRSGHNSLRLQRRSSVFVNQFFKETGSAKQSKIRPRCECPLSKYLFLGEVRLGGLLTADRNPEMNLSVVFVGYVNTARPFFQILNKSIDFHQT
jgi:hypothetical protein